MQLVQILSTYLPLIVYLAVLVLCVLGIFVLLKANKLMKLKIQKETMVKRPEAPKKPAARPLQK